MIFKSGVFSKVKWFFIRENLLFVYLRKSAGIFFYIPVL